MGSDVISLAFQWDCDEFLQRVFLQLDPHSLKTTRTVIKERSRIGTITNKDFAGLLTME